MHFSTVTGYDAHPNGLDFIMLHEVMHMTPEGQAYNALMWELHLQAGGTFATFNGSSDVFRSGEVYINAAARSVLQQFSAGSDITPVTTNPDSSKWMPPWGSE